MARVRHPNLQDASGHYLEGATVTAITNRDTDLDADAVTTEGGGTSVTYPVTSGSEGELDIWVPVGSYETTFGDDSVDTPAVWEAISGEEIANMLTVDDIAGFPDYVKSPLTYGGDPTGVADSTTALQAAIDAADAVNGTVHLGNGTSIWKFSSTLLGASDTRITSASGGAGGPGKAKLLWAGTGTDSALKYTGKFRYEIDHINFEYSSDTWTGVMLDLNGVGGDAINWHVHHCHFRGNTGGTGEIHSRALIRCHKAIIGKISECGFDKAVNHIMLGDPENTASYVNNIQVTDCTFNDTHNYDQPEIGPYDSGQILIGSGDAENLTITNCTFEGAGVGLTAIRGTSGFQGDTRANLIYNMTIRNCWFGDQGGTGNAIMGLNGQSVNGNILISNCYATGVGTFFIAGVNGCRIALVCNKIVCDTLLDVLDTGTIGMTQMGGNAFNITDKFSVAAAGSNFINLDHNNLSSAPSGAEPSTLPFMRLPPRVGFGSNSSGYSNNWDPTGSPAAGESMVIGTGATALVAIGDRVGMYRRSITGGSALTLQAGTNDSDNEVQIVAGTTPATKVRVNQTGICLDGGTPVANQTYTESNVTTDRTYDANSTTLDEVADVLGTLIKDLRAKGLVD